MTKIIHINKSPRHYLPFISGEKSEVKWTYLNIYYLRELKDTYLVVRQNQGMSVKKICEEIALKVMPENKSWEGTGKKKGRKALEPLTALKKFNLIDSNHYILTDIFQESILNAPLSDTDRESLVSIFFNYSRFKELMAWFISPSNEENAQIITKISKDYLTQNSKPLFFFADGFRFNNTFIYDLKTDTDLYLINGNATHLMRFWDVFIKWGTTLNLIEKFSLEHSDYKILSSDNLSKLKSFSCAYFLSGRKEEIDVISFAKNRFKSKRIYLPELVLEICLNFRISVEDSKEIVIFQGRKHKDFIGFERTSEIFVKIGEFKKKQKETIFFPLFQDSFISHLNLK